MEHNADVGNGGVTNKPRNADAKAERRRNDKIRKRDTKAPENILRDLEAVDDEKRFDVLSGKYNDLYDKYRIACNEQSQLNKQVSSLQREKETIQVEHNRVILARTRLEVLCRELQKQNKSVKDQCVNKIRDEEERRKSMTAKFQETLAEVSTAVQENTEKNLRIRDENLGMVQKIRELYNEFEVRKEQASRMEQQMDLERQLYKAEMDKVKLEYDSDREIWAKEKKMLQDKIARSEKSSNQLQSQIDKLQKTLEDYTSKYSTFEGHVSKSNQAFDNCKSELNGMAKRIETLSKDSKVWKQRFENNSKTIVDLKKMKAGLEGKVERTDRQLSSLQKLCHQLQLERTSYMRQLKQVGVKPAIIIAPQAGDSEDVLKTKEAEMEALKANAKGVPNPFETTLKRDFFGGPFFKNLFTNDISKEEQQKWDEEWQKFNAFITSHNKAEQAKNKEHMKATANKSK